MSADGTFHAINPATSELLEPAFRDATADEIDRTVMGAAEAFLLFRKVDGANRAEFLEAIADEIMALDDALIETCVKETGLPAQRLVGERGRTVGQLRLFAEVVREGSWVEARIDPGIPDRQPLPRPDIRRMLVALGPVAVFGAGNFPLAFSVAGGDTASALAAGCPVIVKAHPAHPSTSQLVGGAVGKAVRRTGMPAGVFSLVQGASNSVGMELVTHPEIKAVGFTGSFRGGKALFDAAVRRPEPIPVYAEMGSVNPVIILPGALEERAGEIAAGLAGSVALGVGQFCTNPGVVLVEESETAAQFLSALAGKLGAVESGVMLTESIANAYEEGVGRLASSDAVELVARGSGSRPHCAGVSALLKTSASALIENPELAEEVFGPSTLVALARGRDELYAAASALGGHLTATIHGTDEDLREHAGLVTLLELKVGRLIVNGYPTGVEVGHAMQHGGPYPATTASWSTSVGTAAIKRFARPVCYQGFPDGLLPPALRDGNPLGIWRLVGGEMARD